MQELLDHPQLFGAVLLAVFAALGAPLVIWAERRAIRRSRGRR